MQTSEKKKAVADSSCYCNSSIFWSEWRGSNPRPDGPKPSALSTAPHPDFYSVVVKHVVKGVFSVFRRYRRLTKNPGISTISGGRIFPVQTCGYTLPNHPRYQLRHTPIVFFCYGLICGQGRIFRPYSLSKRSEIQGVSTFPASADLRLSPDRIRSQSRRAANCAAPRYFFCCGRD